MTTWLESLQVRVEAMAQVQPSLMLSIRRRCRPVAYAAIAVGTFWTASSASAIYGGSDVTDVLDNLRIASSTLVGGLLLAAIVHWDGLEESKPSDNAGDPP